MSRLFNWVLGIQAIPILLAGAQTLLMPGPDDTTPPATKHIMGLTSLTLGTMQLTLALTSSEKDLRNILAVMVPTKILAAVLFTGDGMTGVAVWEGVTGAVYAALAALY